MIAEGTPGPDAADVSLAERLAFERLLGDLSALFADLPAAPIREQVCRAAWLGVSLDPALNAAQVAGATRISTPDSAVEVWTIPTNEKLMIARHIWSLLNPTASRAAS